LAKEEVKKKAKPYSPPTPIPNNRLNHVSGVMVTGYSLYGNVFYYCEEPLRERTKRQKAPLGGPGYNEF
jgi:hypothetical protein